MPASGAYLRAKDQLTRAIKEGKNVDRAMLWPFAKAVRLFSIFITSRTLPPPRDLTSRRMKQEVPAEPSNDARSIAECCTPRNDVSLLGNIVDAVKHSDLTHRPDECDLAAHDAILVIGSGRGRFATDYHCESARMLGFENEN